MFPVGIVTKSHLKFVTISIEMERNMCPLSDWMVCPSPGCVNSEVKLSGHSHFPSSPRIIAVISIALIGLIQTEERCRGRGRCRAKTDPGRDNRFFDTPGASVGCCLRQIRDRKTKSYHGFYLLSQISQKLSRGNNLSITCHSVTGCPIILLLVTLCSTGWCCPRHCPWVLNTGPSHSLMSGPGT